MLITYILLLAFSMSLIPYTIDPYLPAFPAMGEFFGVPNATIQASFAGVTVGLAAGHLFSGPLSDAFGRRPLLLISTFGFAASAIALFFTTEIAVFFALRFDKELGLGLDPVGRGISRPTHRLAPLTNIISACGNLILRDDRGGFRGCSLGWRNFGLGSGFRWSFEGLLGRRSDCFFGLDHFGLGLCFAFLGRHNGGIVETHRWDLQNKSSKISA
jgi:MFS family permease